MISVVQLGRVSYSDGLRLQQALVDLRKEGKIGDVLLLLEHDPVITLGRNARRQNLLASDELLRARGVGVFECDRGGDVTYHGPGQLVGYPIFDLRSMRADFPESADVLHHADRKVLGAVDYVRRLEEVLIRTCADCSIAATRIAGLTGVWTEPASAGAGLRPAQGESGVGAGLRPAQGESETRPYTGSAKIAAIGVHISRGVTSHGFALNVTNEPLEYFQLIVPCGISDKPVTSIETELRGDSRPRLSGGSQERGLSLDEVARAIARHIGRVFRQQILWVESLDQLLGRALDIPARAPANERRVAGEDETFWA